MADYVKMDTRSSILVVCVVISCGPFSLSLGFVRCLVAIGFSLRLFIFVV